MLPTPFRPLSNRKETDRISRLTGPLPSPFSFQQHSSISVEEAAGKTFFHNTINHLSNK
jgi:hypothetical protein